MENQSMDLAQRDSRVERQRIRYDGFSHGLNIPEVMILSFVYTPFTLVSPFLYV
jgi:hypothetical protein